MNLTVLKAIYKRDFISYFSNPTGYVFICVFVMLSAIAAFWPPEFFNNNLANLDQLTKWIPWIMLVFIPAITMSTWAEERRQGTDELLLTLPADDKDVVLGKYLAGVTIFTVSLLFSMFSIWLVFSWGLGSPDGGLFLCTYFGYWLLGVAMLAIGMVASFLTSNLTVGFVLGMLFNAPLAVLGWADWIVKDPALAQLVSRWSAAWQLTDFQRGVISLSGVTYFLSIAVVMLYVCMALIGRRHWGTGEDGDSRWAHYLARAVSLLLIFGGLNVFISNYNSLRADVTTERINSLSAKTIEILDNLRGNDDVDTILVEAYVSPQVPAEYAAHKLNLLGTLQELESMSGGKVRANVFEIENFSEAAATAENAYGITPQRINTMSRGVVSQEEIFMGVAVRHKLDKVVMPFIDKGIPVEYELVRSIATVANEKRSRVGVVRTDVELFEGFSMQGMTEESQLITELKKQYDVVEVDPNVPITDTYDVLLAVQPSSMSPEAMNHLVDAVKRGQPVAVFEDPMPVLWSAPGTGQPRMAGGGGMMGMMGGQQLPKGDINQLWKVLGVRMYADEIVLQEYNPYPQYPFGPDFVFIDEGLVSHGVEKPFGDHSVVRGMKQVLFLRPGGLRHDEDSKLEFKPLASTGKLTATIPYRVLRQIGDASNLPLEQVKTDDLYTVTAMVEGDYVDDEDLSLSLAAAGEESDEAEVDAEEPQPLEKTKIRGIVVSDVDCLADIFFEIRARGDQNFANFAELDFQNVAFVLNILDYLAGDDRFIEIRKRTRPHRVLTKIEEATRDSRDKLRNDIEAAKQEAEEKREAAQQAFSQRIQELQNRTDLSQQELAMLVARERERGQRALNRELDRVDKNLNREIVHTQRELDKQVRSVQDRYKFFAFVLPPILPILLGIFVYIHRRQGEREGVAKSRLRYHQKEMTNEQ